MIERTKWRRCQIATSTTNFYIGTATIKRVLVGMVWCFQAIRILLFWIWNCHKCVSSWGTTPSSHNQYTHIVGGGKVVGSKMKGVLQLCGCKKKPRKKVTWKRNTRVAMTKTGRVNHENLHRILCNDVKVSQLEWKLHSSQEPNLKTNEPPKWANPAKVSQSEPILKLDQKSYFHN